MASTNQKARKMIDRWEVGVLSFLTYSLTTQDFSLPGIFAHRSESSQWEPSLPGTKVPGNFRFRERMFLGNSWYSQFAF